MFLVLRILSQKVLVRTRAERPLPLHHKNDNDANQYQPEKANIMAIVPPLWRRSRAPAHVHDYASKTFTCYLSRLPCHCRGKSFNISDVLRWLVVLLTLVIACQSIPPPSQARKRLEQASWEVSCWRYHLDAAAKTSTRLTNFEMMFSSISTCCLACQSILHSFLQTSAKIISKLSERWGFGAGISPQLQLLQRVLIN